jgi:hypothetical protein
MSDVSTFVRRGHTDAEAINKLLALITPLAFPDPEESSLKERVILHTPVRLRTNSVQAGLDIMSVNSKTRDRISSSITLLPDTPTPSAFPVSETVVGTLDMITNKKFGAGATFNATQYISIPDDNIMDLSLPYFTMAFWFKSTDQGISTIYNKTTGSSDGLRVQVSGNTVEDFSTASGDFEATDFQLGTTTEQISIYISDGSNTVNESITLTDLFDGNWHSIVIISTDSITDFCSVCGDFEATDFNIVSSPEIRVYYDKSSAGTIDHSALTGDLSNSEDAIIGAEDISLTNPLTGALALFEYQATDWDTDDVDDFNDDARIRVAGQKVAFHFTGNDTGQTTLETIAF